LANVDVLSDLLGMDLTLSVAEHPVGGFSLDVLGLDEATGRTVIVENQLEQSDHAHLGQILTYAAGTDPTTIVWVTTGFRPEHRAAIDWLNERTDEDTRFFGVEIGVVRIAESMPAPAFTLVAQPNDWEKQVRRTITSTEPTARARLYWDFWEIARTRILQDHRGWTRARTSTRDSWFSMSAGAAGATYSMAFTRQGLGAQIVFEDADAHVNTKRFESLLEQRGDFEQAAGCAVVWERLDGRKSCRVSCYSEEFTDVAMTEQWPAMLDWLLDRQVRLRRALEMVGGIPPIGGETDPLAGLGDPEN
jgi:hypothetical protein